jgi:hypothetical protein
MNGALKVIRSWNTECVFCTCLSTTSCICQATLLRCFCATHEHNFLKTWMGIGRNRMPGRGITCLPCNHRPETKWFWAYSPDISWFKAESNYRYIHPHPPIRQLLFCFKKKRLKAVRPALEPEPGDHLRWRPVLRPQTLCSRWCSDLGRNRSSPPAVLLSKMWLWHTVAVCLYLYQPVN